MICCLLLIALLLNYFYRKNLLLFTPQQQQQLFSHLPGPYKVFRCLDGATLGLEHYNAAAAENSKGQNQEGAAKVEELVVVRAAVTTAMAAAPVHSFHHLDQDD